eukprot:gene18379-24851_t
MHELSVRQRPHADMRPSLTDVIHSSPEGIAIKQELEARSQGTSPAVNLEAWGFSHTPSLHQLTKEAEEQRHECEHEALGLTDYFTGLAASLVFPVSVQAEELEKQRGVIKIHINGAWSEEAVRQGVGHAVSGEYAEAHGCYNKALELDPVSESDFRRALSLDPDNKNAAQYLEAVLKHQLSKHQAKPHGDAHAGHAGTLMQIKRSKHQAKLPGGSHQDQQHPAQKLREGSSDGTSSSSDSGALEDPFTGVVGPEQIRQAIQEVLRAKEKKKHSKKDKHHKKHKKQHKKSSSHGKKHKHKR